MESQVRYSDGERGVIRDKIYKLRNRIRGRNYNNR